MSRKKKESEKNNTFLPWLTANPNGFHENETRYIKMPMNMVMDKRLSKLKDSSFRLYLCMAFECGGKHTFRFSHADAKKYGINHNTFDSCVRELTNVRMIEEINNDDLNRFKKKEFRFTPEFWKAMTVEQFSEALINGRKK